MSEKRTAYLLALLYGVVLMAMSYVLQLYQFTALEEVHVMLYDCDHLSKLMGRPGGIAMIAGSFTSQFFIYRYLGPLIAGIAYLTIILCGTWLLQQQKRPLVLSPLTVLPCLCLMLCLEKSSYFWFGTIAIMLNYIALMLFALWTKRMSKKWLWVTGIVTAAGMYWASGSSALVLGLCIGCWCAKTSALSFKKSIAGILAILAIQTLAAYLSYAWGLLPTLSEAFTPAMYYEMGSSYFMYAYALIAMAGSCLIIIFAKSKSVQATKRAIVEALSTFIACLGASVYVFTLVHSRSNYENQQQRYYVRHNMWDEIISMPYDGASTPYMSYRFLALAQKGMLSNNVKNYHPFITYMFKNQPLTKRRDQQVYSDIWHACDYMAAARKASFDTDIVTPGQFNPVETCKLAEINIAYGDYGVAEKMLDMLDKTLFYADWAKDRRRYLYNDTLVMSDAVLGSKRRAIPTVNEYMSPKGIQRDLKHIVESNPEQVCAKQFYDTFLILTNQR